MTHASSFLRLVCLLALTCVSPHAGAAGELAGDVGPVLVRAFGADRLQFELEKSKKQKKYAVEVLVLHATNSKKGIDKRIGPMPELKKPPFSSYDSYELLAKTRMKLNMDAPERYTLPNKRILQTRLLEILPKEFIRISASINQPKGKDFLPLLQVKAKVGQTFIVAGQSYNGGILVLVFRVVAG